MDTTAEFFSRMEAEQQVDDQSQGAHDVDVDFAITESGRTTIRNVDADEDLDEMDFSILTSARTLGNTERSMATIGTIDTNYTEGSIDSVSSSILESRSVEKNSGRSSDPKEHDKLRPEGNLSQNAYQQTQQQHPFQPLKPLPEHLPRERSAPRAIPKSTEPQQYQQAALGPSTSQPNSAGSTASAFLNSLMDPAASTFNSTHVSHTPPTQIATSYEASHFGKRARSGSVSERLKVSTELEQKGLIDREQKGILKDLIISGQDNELQHALDRYEQGDAALLESILQSGTLSDKANDIDLLGDLDLDFLNVTDSGIREMTSQNISYQPTSHSDGSMISASHRDHGNLVGGRGETPNGTAMEASDGIGELDFDGGMDGGDTLGPLNSNYRSLSPMYNPGQRSRSNSTFSVDLDYRQRSNSLFSALIGTMTPQEGTPVEYGNWMERNMEQNNAPFASEGIRIDRSTRRASDSEIPSNLSLSMAVEDKKLTASQKRELRAEEKRRERQERKEQKEREKREKKEKREQAKLEKQKKAEIEEKIEHEPGSGRPRSMSDPSIRTSIDSNGLLQVERPDGWIGAYSPESRKVRIARFLEKRNHRVWTKTVKYDVRKNFADSRLRVKGRFVKKEDELLMRELMSLT